MAKFSRRNFLTLAGGAPFVLGPHHLLNGEPQTTFNPAESFDPWLEINLNHLAWNLRQIRALVQNRPVMAVIKANAYGHGLVEVGRFLERQGVHALAVGKVSEAIRLRENGVKCPVLNFGPFSSQEAEGLVRLGISQSVFTDGVDDLAAAARKLRKRARVHLKIDTGLGRVGVPYYQALPFMEKVASRPDIEIEGIFTTFTEDEQFDRVQLQRFLQLCEAARKRGIQLGLRHAASSAAVLGFPPAHLDMVRPGITIYGHYPSRKEEKRKRVQLKPAMALKTRISYLKTLRPGDSVSYHRKFTATTETPVATLPIGYSDGLPPQVANRGQAIVGGKRWPLIAAVTANHATLNLSGAENVAIGDEVILIGTRDGTEIKARELAEWADTSVYKILIGMNPLLPRLFTEKG